MSMTDPIADLLTRIRNANRNEVAHVDIPASSMKQSVLEVFKREGFINGYEVIEGSVSPVLRVNLKYGPSGEKIIRLIRRDSRPGRRLYNKVSEIKPVLNGLGICVYSTPKGVLSDRECRAANVGGERICTLW